MKSSVIVFPGSNCDRDIAVALEKLQFKNKMVWHKETKLPKSDLIVVPGGFSYGDYLRSGAIAGKSLIDALIESHSKLRVQSNEVSPTESPLLSNTFTVHGMVTSCSVNEETRLMVIVRLLDPSSTRVKVKSEIALVSYS